MPFLPMTQGHENSGVISAIGEGVTGWKIGDGGLGQIGARAAVLAGAEVHVAVLKEEVWCSPGRPV